ncbi:SDR family NAD(P)-dependent oxidoreductase [Streptomyces parvulus]|uniref:SDR family NAD(P)-dependent oxidoreductase n=1 Tax=Streptomyces parvulus TaxID=146923 RepID=A0A369UV96_9ACTN|nr:SDR family NAD(P)-dependent oxidoreductase [Streptomyces parvulus]RDD83925.1 SDR family NAD(P)-dependent oxidoreductase [Streptomyces parvulus]
MKLNGAIALVTGADHGIGRHIAAQLVTRGTKVYATSPRPESINIYGVQVLSMDIADSAAITAAAEAADDVNLLINHAGFEGGAPPGDTTSDAHFWGTLSMVRAFAPVLAKNGGGAIVNIASARSWLVPPGSSARAASTAVVRGMSDVLRQVLAGQGTRVTSVHMGTGDAGAKEPDAPQVSLADVAHAALNGIDADAFEVVVDEFTALLKTSLRRDPAR